MEAVLVADETNRPRRRTRSDGSGSVTALARRGVEQLGELLGRAPESVVSVAPGEKEGWRIGVDVVEVHRIPETADVLATYEVDLDGEGQLTGYRRVRRYVRGQVKD
jgi:hypothetical protein